MRSQLSEVTVSFTFDSVRPHAPMPDTERVAGEISANPPDAFVAVGGGSASDTAKGLAILLAEGGRLADACSTFTPPDTLKSVTLKRPKIPVVAVPTSFSGAEVTPGGGSTDEAGIKRVFWDPALAARVVIMDTDLLADAPDDLLVTTGMNGLAHCAEGLYSRTATAFSSALAVDGARLFAWSLPRIPGSTGAERLAVLERAAQAACLGGMVISNARVGLHHAVCHVLGAALGLPHGVANAVMLPYVLEFNLDETESQQGRLADALAEGLDEDQKLGAAGLAQMVQLRSGAPATLEATGVEYAELDRVAQDVMQDRGLFFNPKQVDDVKQVRGLLERAWHGLLGAVR